MTVLLPLLLGLAALAYILMPLWAGESKRELRSTDYVPGVEELDLDRDLEKIDDAEWQGRRLLLEQAAPSALPPLLNVERLIWNFRRARRADLAAEAEIWVARERRKRGASPD